MKTPLSELVNEQLIQELKKKVKELPKISFEQSMQFLLNDGMLPESGLKVSSFLIIEDWARQFSSKTLTFTATELKNKTGLIMETVLQGNSVKIVKHGRPVIEIRRVGGFERV